MPKTNRNFWKNKLNSNVMRDKKVSILLRKKGWNIYKLWECQLERKRNKTLNKLADYIRSKK